MVILNVPSREKKYKKKDNLFILTEDLDFSLISYKNNTNNIDSLITGTIKEEIGRKQDEILYSLDNNKNFILISAFKNIFKLICLNYEMKIIEKYKDFTIKYQYEDILFLSRFSLDCYMNHDNKNLLSFAVIKTDIIDSKKILK